MIHEQSSEKSDDKVSKKHISRPKCLIEEPPAIPTQEAVEGIRFDFNLGLRVLIPLNGKDYLLSVFDLKSGLCLNNSVLKSGQLFISTKRYFIWYRLMISDAVSKEPLFVHDYDATGRPVVCQLDSDAIGDTLAWVPHIEQFQKRHQCKMYVAAGAHMAELLAPQYPDLTFVDRCVTPEIKPYATYYLAFFNINSFDWQPVDQVYAGVHGTAAYILGNADCSAIRPRLNLSAPRRIPEKYVCISVQSVSLAKLWNNPTGWSEVIDYLKREGYRVLCMDRDRVVGICGIYNRVPPEAEDFTGNLPLQERVDIIKDAEFFIGLASGLSWLAWGCNVPVVMISGFSHPNIEFPTPYRVINYNVCNSCWATEHKDGWEFWTCPRHKDTPRQFECSVMITSFMVIRAIERLRKDFNR